MRTCPRKRATFRTLKKLRKGKGNKKLSVPPKIKTNENWSKKTPEEPENVPIALRRIVGYHPGFRSSIWLNFGICQQVVKEPGAVALFAGCRPCNGFRTGCLQHFLKKSGLQPKNLQFDSMMVRKSRNTMAFVF